MLGVWQRLVLFLVYGQLLTGVWGNQIWFEILDNWGKLEKDETIGTNYRNLLKYLDYENKHRDPMMRTIGNGMRDQSHVESVKHKLFEWKKSPTIAQHPGTKKWYNVDSYQLMKVTPGSNRNGMQIDHFFELQFSGPIMVVAMKKCTDDPFCQSTTMEEELFFGRVGPVLKGILNHPDNLALIPASTNSLKTVFLTTYLTDKAIPASDETAKLLGYLTDMAPIFKAHITEVKKLIEKDQAVTILHKLVDILEQTPFATGTWGDITYSESLLVNGEFKPHIRIRRSGGNNDNINRVNIDAHITRFQDRVYDEANFIDLALLIKYENDRELGDGSFNMILEDTLTNSIEQSGDALCEVPSQLAQLQNPNFEPEICAKISSLVTDCYMLMVYVLLDINKRICLPKLSNAKSHYKYARDMLNEMEKLQTAPDKVMKILERVRKRMRAWSYLEDTPKRIRTSMKEAKRLHKESSNVLQDISGKIPEDCKKLLDNLEEHIKSNSIQEESP